jgi:hypothetical protein
MSDLNQVRLQVLDANTGAVVDNVDAKTSDAAVYLQDGTTLRNWIGTVDDAQALIQQKISAHLAQQHVDPAKVNSILTGLSFNSSTGVFTITTHDGQTSEIDTLLEKVTVNFTLVDGEEGTNDAGKTFLVLTAEDNTTQKLDVTKLIDVYEGTTGTQVAVAVSSDKKISASIVAGSITATELSTELQNAINATYTLPAATTTTLGGVIVGDGISVDESGKISAANVKQGDTAVALNLSEEESTVVLSVTGPADTVVTTTVGTAVAAQTVAATASGSASSSATIAYQWYKKVIGTDVAFSAISGATAATLPAASIDVSAAGTTVYYAVASATGEGVVADPVASQKVTVIVNAAA